MSLPKDAPPAGPPPPATRGAKRDRRATSRDELSDRTVDRIFELASAGATMPAIVAAVGVRAERIRAALAERPTSWCAECLLRCRVNELGRARWHRARVDDAEPCAGTGKRAMLRAGGRTARRIERRAPELVPDPPEDERDDL